MLVTRREFLRASVATGTLVGAGLGTGLAPTGAGSRRIVKAMVHPAVGIARVGNSAESFYFAPDVPDVRPRPRTGFKDPSGAVARQAARFRLYGVDDRGGVRELTAADGAITWTVTVANAKATWYEFDMPLDLPIAQPARRRNPDRHGGDRQALLIAPSPRSITGRAAGPVPLDGGTFLGTPVGLGELMTDAGGRLVFLPGSGRGYSPTGAPLNFFNNVGWADDTADGTVQASIRIDGRVIEADPGWVIAAPPNFGPSIAASVVSLYDLARSTFVHAGWEPEGSVSLVEDILAIFARLADLQWVNAGYFQAHAWGTPGDYAARSFVDRLGDRRASNRTFRTRLFAQFRDPSFAQPQPNAIPDLYGDGTTIPTTNNWKWLAVTPLQYAKLRRWANGDFVDDRGRSQPPATLEAYPARRQPAVLDRAALQACIGGAFHPGIEAPWSLRVASMWQAPFRLRVRSTTATVQDYGDPLTPQTALAPDGPLQGSAPGDVTRWMGVPWHSDVAGCRAGYELSVSSVLPTFWPARVPNHVLREVDYKIVMDRSQPMAKRRAAYERRIDWERHIAQPQERPPTIELMVQSWYKLGVVTERPGPGDREFPPTMKVETALGFDFEPTQVFGPGR